MFKHCGSQGTKRSGALNPIFVPGSTFTLQPQFFSCPLQEGGKFYALSKSFFFGIVNCASKFMVLQTPETCAAVFISSPRFLQRTVQFFCCNNVKLILTFSGNNVDICILLTQKTIARRLWIQWHFWCRIVFVLKIFFFFCQNVPFCHSTIFNAVFQLLSMVTEGKLP